MTGLSQLTSGMLGSVLTDIQHGDGGTPLGEKLRGRSADAAASACHQRPTSGK